MRCNGQALRRASGWPHEFQIRLRIGVQRPHAGRREAFHSTSSWEDEQGYQIWKTLKITHKGLKKGCLPTAELAVPSQYSSRAYTRQAD